MTEFKVIWRIRKNYGSVYLVTPISRASGETKPANVS